MNTETLPYAAPSSEVVYIPLEAELQKKIRAQDAHEKLCFNVALGCGLLFIASIANTCMKIAAKDSDIGIDIAAFGAITFPVASFSAWRSRKLKGKNHEQYSSIYTNSDGVEKYMNLVNNRLGGSWIERLAGFGTGGLIISTMNENLDVMYNPDTTQLMEAGATFSIMMLAVAICWKMRHKNQDSELGQAL